ncbi:MULTISPECIES: glycerophosphodiester phosphodiesterase family protein [Proteus]|jgi:glycerophosphoryl diester phosphodiesterase|uniref:Glycerophosphoryl diester phosphodiesterase n=1 Tax=Proteus vulgaris TaxID=585 RepID=A0A379F831_PROVU|nr:MULTISPECIES: glycerophosphodiester phosphodiesterase family protein [Proteus]NBN59477.1 glycerophosphoryl diester phosphodiesterase [Proteus sp. G2639]RNT25932.1 glycerophosphoryl diester phosphodiesterase [Proteus mirabilis]AYY79348.1 glycerophosphoryl diester phosphodiesterase [Proteus vulgaris]KGA56396.1 glycerophosphoryl diester phosphodiesterase family protein [Proteus vulgaris]MBG5970662.1 glycerophosphoryl diester phosphodiesterase [Proteus vulgaris]
MKIAAHRGFSGKAPENTLAAFKMAIDFGCEWIETDVQLTADYVPVLIHDKTVNRCTNGQGAVRFHTLDDLHHLDAGSWFSSLYQGEKIPSLRQGLQLIKRSGTKLNIELKTWPDDDIERLCLAVSDMIKSADIPNEQILFSSFDTQALIVMKRYLPFIRRGQLWDEIPANALEILKAIDGFSVHCNYKYLTQEQAQWLKQAGYEIYCYTPNDPEEVKDFEQWGVDMLITDMPDVYQQDIDDIAK